MTGVTKAPDFRMLAAMRAAMRQSHAVTALPIEDASPKTKRRGLRRVLREIARPFERVGKSCRRAYKTRPNPFRRLRAKAALPQTPDTGDLPRLAAALDELRAQQVLTRRRVERQPLATADGLLLMRIDDRNLLVPCGDFALIGALIGADDYEPGLSAALRRLARHAGMVIDVGANVGWHTVTLARLLRPDGKLLALEPAPLAFRALQASVIANGLAARVDTRQIAVGDEAGERLLPQPNSGPNGAVPVAVATLDSLIAPGTCIDLIKIEAREAEFAILGGMTRILAESPDIVVMVKIGATDLQPAGASSMDVIELMAEQGFSAFSVDNADGHLSPLDPQRAVEAAIVAFSRRDLVHSTAAE